MSATSSATLAPQYHDYKTCNSPRCAGARKVIENGHELILANWTNMGIVNIKIWDGRTIRIMNDFALKLAGMLSLKVVVMSIQQLPTSANTNASGQEPLYDLISMDDMPVEFASEDNAEPSGASTAANPSTTDSKALDKKS